MKRLRTLLVVAAFAGLVGVVGVSSASAQRSGHTPAGGGAVKPDPYVVVQTGADLEVMARSEFVTRKKSAAEKYKTDMKEYKDAKKAAAKSKEKFEGQKPVKVEPKQIGSTFKTKEEADAYCEKRKREKEEGKGEKKTASS